MNGFKEAYKIAASGEQLKLLTFIFLLVISVSFSFVLSALYVHFTKRRFVNDVNLYKLYPLVALATTSIFATLQFSIPLSLGLLGSLSIVRFRMHLKDPLEIGMVLVVIANSLLAATANFGLLVAVVFLAAATLFIIHKDPFSLISNRLSSGILLVNVPSDVYRGMEKEILALFSGRHPKGYLDSVTERDGKCSIAFRFSEFESADLAAFREKIGTQAEFNLFYNKEGSIR